MNTWRLVITLGVLWLLASPGRTDIVFVEVERAPRDIQIREVAGGKVLQQFEGDGWKPNAAQFSPDGKTVAYEDGNSGRIILRDASSGEWLDSVPGIAPFAFSPDGKTLATRVDAVKIKLWRLSDGAELRALEGHAGYIRAVAFSPDGKTVATGSGDNTIRLWSAATGACLKILTGHTGFVLSVAFSPDGKWLASGSDDSTARLWEVATGKLARTLPEHSEAVTAMAFSPDGKTLAGASRDTTIILWDVATGRVLRTLAGHSNGVLSLAYRPDGTALASGSDDNTVRLWDLKTGFTARTWSGHPRGVSSVAFSPDGKKLVSGNAFDRYQNVIQLSITPGGHKAQIGDVAVTNDRRFLVSSGDDKTIKIWDAATGAVVDTIRGQSSLVEGSIAGMALSPDNRFLAVGVLMAGNPIRLYDFPRRKLIGVLRGHGGTVFSLAFSDDSRLLVSGSHDKTIKLWSVAERRLVRTFTGHTGAVYGVALHGRRMVSGSLDGTVRLWDIEQRAALKTSREVGDRVFGVAFAPDGDHIAAIGKYNEKLLLFDGDLNPQQTIANGTGARHLCFSPDGQKLLLGRRAEGSAPACHVYERTGDRWQLAGTQDGQQGYVEGVAFLDDATAVTAGGDAHTIALWKWDGGKAHIVCTLAGQGRPIGAVGIAGSVLAYSDALAAPHQSVPLTKAFDLAAPGLKPLENGARFTGPQTQNGPYRLQHAAGGAYGYGDAVLNIQKDGQTVASITRTGYDGYSHTAYTFTPDRTIISGGLNGHLIAYDVRGRVLAEFRGHEDNITALAVSADGKRLVSASRDQTIKLWNLEEVGQKRWIFPVVTLFIGADNEWVMWTAEGYYTASPNGAKYIGWQKNRSDTEDALFYSADQLFAEYYRPEIVQAAVQSGAPAEQVVADLGVRAAPPIEKSLEGVPEVKIIWDSGSPDDDAVQVTVEARDTGGGVQEIGLFRNNKRVSNAQAGDKGFIRVAPGEKTALTYMVTLEPGENELKAVAFNAARTQSALATLTIRHKATRPTANLYLVTVGINDYKNDTYRLSWARSDAEAFAAAVEKSGGGIFQRVIPLALADDEAVRANLETALRRIAEGDAASNIPKARPEDVFVFYYAGHGTMSEGEPNKPPDFYLVLSDIVRMTDDDQLAKQGIAAGELVDWCSRIDAGKQLVVLDACQSGGAVQRFAQRGAAQEKAITQLARSAGLAVFASAGTEQYASEVGDLGHGLFTYALLEGLSGKAEIGDPGDGKITINELMAYLNDTVPKLTERFRRKEQYPDVYFRGNDFPLGVR